MAVQNFESETRNSQIATIMGPVARLVQSRQQPCLYLEPEFVLPQKPPKWLDLAFQLLEVINDDIKNGAEFLGPDNRPMPILEMSENAQLEAISRLLNSQTRGRLRLERTVPGEILKLSR